MNRKKGVYLAASIFGVLLAAAALLLDHIIPKSLGGVMLGVGVGLAAMFAAKLQMIRYEQKNPELTRRSRIEEADERNAMIRSRAKARAGDITKWAVITVAYLFILLDAPLWATLSTIAVFVLYNILTIYYTAHYQKEL